MKTKMKNLDVFLDRRSACVDALHKSIGHNDKLMLLALVTAWLPVDELEKITKQIVKTNAL